MYKYSAKSNLVLSVLSVLALLAFFAVENSKVDVKRAWFNEKLQAAELSAEAMEYLRTLRLEKGIVVDDINDPNETLLIGQEYSPITTDRGYIESKLTSLNPNFAAVVVQCLHDAGVEKGDNVAVAMTGSFPALNISTIAALQTLGTNPLVITSVGASNYGANDPWFTWLDMEKALNDAGIFHCQSIAASCGGGNDLGRGLSPQGRDMIKDAILRNDIPLIHEKYLEQSIDKRMEFYHENANNKPVKAYINIGGGIASLGSAINGKIIPPGVTEFLPGHNFPVKGTMILMGENNIPIIHLLSIPELAEMYGLPQSPVPLPDPGDGEIFVQKKYNLYVAGAATAILIILVLLIYFGERRFIKLGTDVVPGTGKDPERFDDSDDFPVL